MSSFKTVINNHIRMCVIKYYFFNIIVDFIKGSKDGD